MVPEVPVATFLTPQLQTGAGHHFLAEYLKLYHSKSGKFSKQFLIRLQFFGSFGKSKYVSSEDEEGYNIQSSTIHRQIDSLRSARICRVLTM